MSKGKQAARVTSGAARAVCVMCGEIPVVCVASRVRPEVGICEKCARMVVGVFDANAQKIAAFQRREAKRLDKATGRGPRREGR